ncbi:hypothetical protein [Devosia indica]
MITSLDVFFPIFVNLYSLSFSRPSAHHTNSNTKKSSSPQIQLDKTKKKTREKKTPEELSISPIFPSFFCFPYRCPSFEWGKNKRKEKKKAVRTKHLPDISLLFSFFFLLIPLIRAGKRKTKKKFKTKK